MTDFDYKKYSLENLEKWVYDALTSAEATPKEIYDVIKGVVHEEYHYFKHHTSRCYELLALLNGTNNLQEQQKVSDKEDDGMRPWGHSDLEYNPEYKNWAHPESGLSKNRQREYNLREAEYYNKRAELDAKKDKVVKWQLPVQQSYVDGVEDYFVQFPDDLLEAANLKEGDQVEWVDQGNGSYLLRKV